MDAGNRGRRNGHGGPPGGLLALHSPAPQTRRDRPFSRARLQNAAQQILRGRTIRRSRRSSASLGLRPRTLENRGRRSHRRHSQRHRPRRHRRRRQRSSYAIRQRAQLRGLGCRRSPRDYRDPLLAFAPPDARNGVQMTPGAHLLTVLIFFPALGALALMILRGDDYVWIRRMALVVGAFEFLLSLLLIPGV